MWEFVNSFEIYRVVIYQENGESDWVYQSFNYKSTYYEYLKQYLQHDHIKIQKYKSETWNVTTESYEDIR